MAISFRCGRCGQLLQAADEAAGRLAACPGCKAQLADNAALPASAREMLQKVKVSQSGARLNVEATVDEATIEQFVGMAAMMGGPGMGGAPGMPPRPVPTRPPRAVKSPRLGRI